MILRISLPALLDSDASGTYMVRRVHYLTYCCRRNRRAEYSNYEERLDDKRRC